MKIIDNYQSELELLEGHIRRQPRGDCALQILEAGCGREWYFCLEGVPHEITGVDLDTEALNFRQNVKRDLKHAIVGDLLTVQLPSDRFDVIYCSFVLEHVRGASRALDNFSRWLKPGGLLIVRVPDVASVQTFFAKRLPRWFAVLYYRHVLGIKNAGKPGFAPYPAFYDEIISRPGFRSYCESRRLDLVEELGVGTYANRGSSRLRYVLPVVARVVHRLSGGKVQDQYIDVTFVARKAPQQEADLVNEQQLAAH
jgi:SAM-dependent methyltransferase